jgi:8-oxo-dGTP pyrophosphatase MutT (NUDIX family)
MATFPIHRLEETARIASVDVAGPFHRGAIELCWTDTPRRTTAELDARIDEIWHRELELANRSGAVLFNGELIRYVGHAVADGALRIDVGATDYKTFLGTNLRSGHWIDEIGCESFANAIGVSALIVSDDEPGFVLLGHRSGKVVDQPNAIHTFGGALDAGDRDSRGVIDVFAAVTRELCEELTLKADEVVGLDCLGLVHDRVIWQPELVFAARVKLGVDELTARVDVASEAAEHLGVERIVESAESLASYMVQSTRTTPAAMSALCLHGWCEFGAEWCTRLLERLS